MSNSVSNSVSKENISVHLDDILVIINEYLSGQIVHDHALEDEFMQLPKETLAQFLRLITVQGILDNVEL